NPAQSVPGMLAPECSTASIDPARPPQRWIGEARSTLRRGDVAFYIHQSTNAPAQRETPFNSRRSRLQTARNYHPLHVAGALVDLAHAHVPVDALDREVLEIAVAAEGLDGRRADLLGHFRGEQLGQIGRASCRERVEA